MNAGSASGVEREIKIPVADLAAVRSRLIELGARLAAARALERNRVYERRDGSDPLLASGRLLRLREDGAGARLTYKGAARFERGTKIREEREVAVDSATTAAQILEGVGFVAVRRYEKRRETWRIECALVTLDETPIGHFVEIEETGEVVEQAPGDGIAAVARRLGLDPTAADPRSYLAIYQAWRAEHPGAPEDMVFVSPEPGRGA